MAAKGGARIQREENVGRVGVVNRKKGFSKENGGGVSTAVWLRAPKERFPSTKHIEQS